MNMEEMTRFIEGLRSAGRTGDQINDFLLYIKSGKEEYKPVSR